MTDDASKQGNSTSQREEEPPNDKFLVVGLGTAAWLKLSFFTFPLR